MSEDRTEEFFGLCRSVEGSTVTPPLHRQTTELHSNVSGAATKYEGRYGNVGPAAASAQSELRDFHSTASSISKEIASTSAMLGELTQLVRRRGLFVNESTDDRVNWLVLKIKSNIEALNGRLDESQRVIARQKRSLGRTSQAGQEATNLVGQLQDEFVRATKGFKDVLQQRSDRMKETTDRRKQVFGGTDSTENERNVALLHKPPVYDSSSTPLKSMNNSMPKLDLTSGMIGNKYGDSIPAGESSSSQSHLPRPPGVSGHGGGSSMYSPDLRLRHTNSNGALGNGVPSFSGSHSSFELGGGGASPMTPLDMMRMEQEAGNEQMMQLIPDQTYLQERADAMSTVETNIVELGTIFNKLAVMVSEHRDLVQRVEDNVDDANSNINLSMATLTDTLDNLRSNRALALKVFGVLVLFIILFITFFA